jgi:chromosome segregation ATPase
MRGSEAVRAILLLASLAWAASAHAQQPSETDRLRDALRAAIAQTRALEDQRTALTARVSETEKKAQTLQTQLDAAKAEAKEADKAQREAVRDFNARIEERNAALEKWKDAYGEAATVARTKDGERAKFEAETAQLKEAVNALKAKNAVLVTVGRDLLERYRAVHLGDRVAAREPVTGIKRVDVQNVLQELGDKILNEEEPK